MKKIRLYSVAPIVFLLAFSVACGVGSVQPPTANEPNYRLPDGSDMYEANLNIDVSADKLYEASDVTAEEYGVDISGITNEIKKIYSGFDMANYKITVNVFADEPRSVLVLFNYWIDGKICTNRAYTVLIENNKATQIIANKAFIDGKNSANIKLVSDNELMALVRDFESKKLNEVLDESIVSGPVVAHVNGYFYDYYSDSLYYSDTLFYEDPAMDNAVVDKQITKYLRGSGEQIFNGVK